MGRSSTCGLLALGWLWLAGPVTADLAVYDDAPRNGFASWSWPADPAFVDLASSSPRHGGEAAVRFLPQDWSGFSLRGDFDPGAFAALELWVHGGGAGGQLLSLQLQLDGAAVGNAVALEGFVSGGAIPADGWAKVTVPLSAPALGIGGAAFNRFTIMGRVEDQPAVHFDDLVLVAAGGGGAAVTVAVDAGAGRRAIAPRVYGVSFGAFGPGVPPYPVRRWGGNWTTRYNWQTDVSNHAADWFFYSYKEGPPGGSAADAFIADTYASGAEPLITLPTIGWRPRSDLDMGGVRWSFSRALYDDPPNLVQTNDEWLETGGEAWAQQDAGNGLFEDDPAVPVVNDPNDVSEPSTPADATAWIAHIESLRGGATAGDPGGVRLYALDNEPMLWHDTHRDVRRDASAPFAMKPPVSYAELWQNTLDYAGAVKADDPQAEVFGPVTWGWCDIFWSALDGCGPGADRAAHAGDTGAGGAAMPDDLLPWYLAKVREHELATGVRLVDWIDLHYYPQVAAVALSAEEGPAVAANRLASLKSLWHPTYKEPSWIGQDLDTAIRYLPRIRAWRDEWLPGARIAVTEYNWGDGDGDGVLADGRSDMNGISSALAQAEVLALFGREGVDLATRWGAPLPGSRIEDAFRMFLDWDGVAVPGTPRIDGESAQAASSDVDAVGAYAIVGTGDDAGRLFLLLFNHRSVATNGVTVSFTGTALAGVPAATYRLSTAGYQRVADSSPAGQTLTVDLPPRTGTLVVLATAVPPAPPALDFHTVTPCRLVDTRSPATGGPALTSNAPRTFTFLDVCGVPATARAVSLNLTVVQPSGNGHVTAWAAGTVAPATSVLNFRAGRTLANHAILPLSANGQAQLSAVAVGGTVHLLVDVNGYFEGN